MKTTLTELLDAYSDAVRQLTLNKVYAEKDYLSANAFERRYVLKVDTTRANIETFVRELERDRNNLLEAAKSVTNIYGANSITLRQLRNATEEDR